MLATTKLKTTRSFIVEGTQTHTQIKNGNTPQVACHCFRHENTVMEIVKDPFIIFPLCRMGMVKPNAMSTLEEF